jgi:hypothetical protein
MSSDASFVSLRLLEAMEHVNGDVGSHARALARFEVGELVMAIVVVCGGVRL